MGNVFQIFGDFLLILYGFLLDSCWILPSTNHGLFLTSKIIGEAIFAAITWQVGYARPTPIQMQVQHGAATN
jgi:hypothetical protein